MAIFLDYILNIDSYLLHIIAQYGHYAYLVLFAVIFTETGLIVTPFLPGDSLLFAVGGLAAQTTESLDVLILFILLSLAAILGNQLNYFIGRFVGLKVFTSNSSWFNKKHIQRTHEFYAKHGRFTIMIARFVPIIRSFAPFVAGLGCMNTLSFFIYNCLSGIVWVGALLALGYFLGSISFVKNHFSLAIYMIIVISFALPLLHTVFLKCKNYESK